MRHSQSRSRSAASAARRTCRAPAAAQQVRAPARRPPPSRRPRRRIRRSSPRQRRWGNRRQTPPPPPAAWPGRRSPSPPAADRPPAGSTTAAVASSRRGKERQQGGHRRRVGIKARVGAGDHAQGALAATQQARRSMPALDRADRGRWSRPRPRGVDPVQPPHVLQGDAQAQAMGSAGVLGDVAADGGGRLTGRIGREVQAVGRCVAA